MHDPEKSDSGIVAMKPMNKAGRPAAELAEPRPGTKGNADQQSTHRTQSRARVTQALDRVRKAARQRKKEQFTSLLHHMNVDSIEAREVVVALGPWSDDVFRPLGYQVPLAVKRGYHMHYGVKGNATLGHSMRDADGGFTLAPMRRGVRLTTGVEFANRDAPPSPVQLARDEPLARELFPLTERLEPEPWMGCRPCLPDMVPVICKGERHQGLWFAFGHAHHGFTLGPVTGRLLAEMMTGEQPFTDPSPYAAVRFQN